MDIVTEYEIASVKGIGLPPSYINKAIDEIKSLRQQLAEQSLVSEPVAWMKPACRIFLNKCFRLHELDKNKEEIISIISFDFEKEYEGDSPEGRFETYKSYREYEIVWNKKIYPASWDNPIRDDEFIPLYTVSKSVDVLVEALQESKQTILDANRNGFTRGLNTLWKINTVLATYSKPITEQKT